MEIRKLNNLMCRAFTSSISDWLSMNESLSVLNNQLFSFQNIEHCGSQHFIMKIVDFKDSGGFIRRSYSLAEDVKALYKRLVQFSSLLFSLICS